MKVNPAKYHYICSTNDTINLIIADQIIDNNKRENFLL